MKKGKEQNIKVKDYWEREPCGTHSYIVGNEKELNFDYFEKIENYRYSIEPFIHEIAQFTRHKGKRILEIGVGAGTDHLQWARAGAELYGVDLTSAAIQMTKKRLQIYNYKSNLKVIDAEELPFEDNKFDVVYSWGVIHHSSNPQIIIDEISRVLKKEGLFIGMLYNRYSISAFQEWLQFALLKGKPFRSLSNVIYNNVESHGTKAYTKKEIKNLFKNYKHIELKPLLTEGDLYKLPNFLRYLVPPKFGWFWGIQAKNN